MTRRAVGPSTGLTRARIRAISPSRCPRRRDLDSKQARAGRVDRDALAAPQDEEEPLAREHGVLYVVELEGKRHAAHEGQAPRRDVEVPAEPRGLIPADHWLASVDHRGASNGDHALAVGKKRTDASVRFELGHRLHAIALTREIRGSLVLRGAGEDLGRIPEGRDRGERSPRGVVRDADDAAVTRAGRHALHSRSLRRYRIGAMGGGTEAGTHSRLRIRTRDPVPGSVPLRMTGCPARAMVGRVGDATATTAKSDRSPRFARAMTGAPALSVPMDSAGRPSGEHMQVGRTKRSRALTGLIVGLGVAVVVIGLTVRFADLHFQTVLSNSMRPTASAGDVAITQGVPVGSIRVGDVIAFMPPGNSQAVMHRVSSLRGAVITTKGDANRVEDPWHVTLAGPTAYRLVAVVPAWLADGIAAARRSARGLLVGLAIVLRCGRR